MSTIFSITNKTGTIPPMPRQAKKKNAKRAQQTILTPPQLIAGILAAIGKPFYKTFTLSFNLLFYIFSLVGKGVRISTWIISNSVENVFKNIQKSLIQNLGTSKQKRDTGAKKFDKVLKLKKLRIELFELSILQKAKLALLSLKNISKKIKFRIKIGFRLSVLLITLIVLSSTFYFLILKDLPSPNELTNREPEVSTKIYDRNGILLYKIYEDKNRTIIPLTEIPLHVRLATLAAEDAEFYNHPGFSLRGIFRALTQSIRTGNLQGGSTITQQLVKNALLSPERTFTRKIKELILAIRVETAYTKDQILEMYLNEVSYGGTAYGIQEASESYFGKGADELTIAEAAFLAGLPKSPTSYSPFGQHPDTAFARQKEVLRLMRINKYISDQTEALALAEKLRFVSNKTEILAPHFVMYIRQLLVDKYGESMVEKGGLEVITSLDFNIQNISEEIVKSEVEKIKGLHVGNGAALVMNPRTGEILSMVGSKNYFDTQTDGQVNVLTRLRQPGSAIKIVNYAYALAKAGFSPGSIIDDSPITYIIPGSKPYSPINYDGKFKGKISLRQALAESRNIPAVKILASYGVPNMVNLGQEMGITSWNNPSDFGLSLTLGGGAVKGIDLAQAYATLANEGTRPQLLPILKVTNYKGKVLEENKYSGKKVLDNRVAYLLIDILKDNVARAAEFGINSFLVVKNHPEVAVKTGTSNDLRDNWTVGFNQDYLVLTWVGNNDNSPMNRIASGVTGATPIWNKIISTLLNNEPSVDWEIPAGISKIFICNEAGVLPCEGCRGRQEWFLNENRPTISCVPTQNKPITFPTPASKILESGISTESN